MSPDAATSTMAVVLVDPAQLVPPRRQLRRMLLPGERELHFYKQQDPRRRKIADRIARLPVETVLYVCPCTRADESARQACLARITRDLLTRNAKRMVLDSRDTSNGDDRDRHDRTTIRRVRTERQSTGRMTWWVPA